MATITETFAKFDGSKCEKYDPGKIVILFDNRIAKSEHDKFSYIQNYWTDALYKLGWPSWEKPNLDPGSIRLVWYTVSDLDLCNLISCLLATVLILNSTPATKEPATSRSGKPTQ